MEMTFPARLLMIFLMALAFMGLGCLIHFLGWQCCDTARWGFL
jgi:hypothetical protein